MSPDQRRFVQRWQNSSARLEVKKSPFCITLNQTGEAVSPPVISKLTEAGMRPEHENRTDISTERKRGLSPAAGDLVGHI